MACPLYCILSAGTVHCIPVTTFTTVQETPAKLTRFPAISAENADAVPNPITPEKRSRPSAQNSPNYGPHYVSAELPSLVKTRNLLYTLNNPSLSDLESEPSRHLSETSFNQDEELTQDEETKALAKSRTSAMHIAASKSVLSRSTNTDSEPDEPTPTMGSGRTLAGGPRDPEQTLREESTNAASVGGERNALFKHLQETTWKRNGASPFPDSDTEQTHSNDMPIGAAVDSPENPDLSAILNDYSTHAVYLPQYSVDLQGNLDTDFSQIRVFLPKIFPAWQAAISIRQLTGGITNMLLSCSHSATDETLLMRVYGKGTNLIIDRNREFVSHLILNSLKLAPPIHARFANGLIYGFLPGRSLDPDELSHPYLYPLIAQQLGHWHNKINCEYIEDGIHRLRKHTASVKKSLQPSSLRAGHAKPRKSINNIWDLMEDWISIIPINDALVKNFSENLGIEDTSMGNMQEKNYEEKINMQLNSNNSNQVNPNKVNPNKVNPNKVNPNKVNSNNSIQVNSNNSIQVNSNNSIQVNSNNSIQVNSNNIRQVIADELRWVRNTLKNARRSEMVVCHCDLLSGNIIIPDTEDFKAKMMSAHGLPKVEDNPIQFIDYEYMIPAPRAFDIANHFAEWQGFDCNREAIPQPSPNNPVMVKWCKGYLNDQNASDEMVNTLIDEIACYSGLPGFYWGIWAMIQSELSIIDFNYAEYSLLRLEEYWLWKRSFSHK